MPVTLYPAPVWAGRQDPEDGPEARRLHDLVEDDARRAVIGFASDTGVRRNQGRPGAHDGPTAIRTALASLSAPAGVQGFSDLGDVEVTGDDLEAGQRALSEKLATALGTFERVVVLGGGHETAFGSYCGLIAAFPGKKVGIINLDAHLDLRLVGKAGPSSGTPFTQIRELDPDGFDYLCLGLAAESNTGALMERARDWGVRIIDDHALIDNKHAADEAITAIMSRSDLVYLTIDIDVLPHFQAPGVSAPASRGVPLDVIEHIIKAVLEWSTEHHCLCPVADIVELCPPHDPQGVTARTAAVLVRRILLDVV